MARKKPSGLGRGLDELLADNTPERKASLTEKKTEDDAKKDSRERAEREAKMKEAAYNPPKVVKRKPYDTPRAGDDDSVYTGKPANGEEKDKNNDSEKGGIKRGKVTRRTWS